MFNLGLITPLQPSEARPFCTPHLMPQELWDFLVWLVPYSSVWLTAWEAPSVVLWGILCSPCSPVHCPTDPSCLGGSQSHCLTRGVCPALQNETRQDLQCLCWSCKLTKFESSKSSFSAWRLKWLSITSAKCQQKQFLTLQVPLKSILFLKIILRSTLIGILKQK